MTQPASQPVFTVPYNRKMSYRLLGSTAIFISFAIVQAIAMHGHPSAVRMFLLVFNCILAAFLALIAIPGLFRTRPLITAGPAGIEVCVFGSQVQRIAWPEVAGVEVVGKGMEQYLVVLAADPDAAIKTLPKVFQSAAHRLNKKFRIGGAVYVIGRAVSGKPEQVADALRTLALQYAEAVAVQDSPASV